METKEKINESIIPLRILNMPENGHFQREKLKRFIIGQMVRQFPSGRAASDPSV